MLSHCVELRNSSGVLEYLVFLLTVLRRRLTFLELKDLCLLFTLSEFLGPGWELSDFL